MMANFELDNDYDGVEVTIKVIGVGGGGGKGRNELRGRVEGNNLQCGGGRRNSGPDRQYRGRKRRGSSALPEGLRSAGYDVRACYCC